MSANYLLNIVSSLLILIIYSLSDLFLVVLSSSSSSVPIPVRSEYEVSLLYEGWLIKHNKSYKDPLENKMRYEIFKDNLKYIDEHNINAGNNTFTLALNVFADITVEEYRSMYLGTLPPPPPGFDTLIDQYNESNETPVLFHFNGTPVTVPDSIDWRDLGAVLPIKNQGGCFSCWAFATIATVEAINQIITGDLTPLSEQQLVDCERKSCDRYDLVPPFEYIIRNGGIDSEQDYPYKAVYNQCDTSKEDNKVVTIDGYKRAPRYNENSLKAHVAKQPVATGVEAYERYFQLYGTGVFTKYCGTNLDHAVALIGYGTDQGSTDYWLIKNSWGVGWGEAGYMRLERNVYDPAGKCGVAKYPAIYPIKTKHAGDGLDQVKEPTGTHSYGFFSEGQTTRRSGK